MRWYLAAVLAVALLTQTASTAWSLATSDDVVFSSGTIPTDLDGNPVSAGLHPQSTMRTPCQPARHTTQLCAVLLQVSAHEGCMLTTEDAYLW